MPAAACLGPHEQVLEIDPVCSEPRREADEPDREADCFAIGVFSDETVHARVEAEQRRTEVFFRRDDGARLAFVGRKLLHQPVDDGNVVCGGRSDQACFVSQKILSISAIFCSSFSASPGSTVPLPPAAPASLGASLNNWCSCGYFSKCGGLK